MNKTKRDRDKAREKWLLGQGANVYRWSATPQPMMDHSFNAGYRAGYADARKKVKQ